MKKFVERLWNIPWVHALVMGLIGAIIGTIYPFANAWLQSQPVPSLKIILFTVLKASVAFVIGYIGKHLLMGPSGPAYILPPVPGPGEAPSGSPVPPGGPPGGSSISQKGKSV